MDIQKLLNSIFFPRKSDFEIDDKDHLVNVDSDVSLGIRLFIKDDSYPTILIYI